ncbi:SNF2-related protein [Corynebacterium pseudodiphtheriticum]|uniref:DEAD/DEAH box helicase n=1 Tax=Corynebacterium pseudodiphtheriticum TaxID=37637 RepID=UPI00254F991F|nr:SNF2-related protein [Corynebacterium pseudodiphtheriticum]MDK8478427.1 SNF2-related protein [Corynebacterium pseudodiphtheriticum]
MDKGRSNLTDHQAKYFAHQLERSYSNDHVGKLAGLLFDAQVEPKPHQIDAALFALQTPYAKGIILADEVGLGKTIEAGIVATQYWAERKRRILIIAPASLRQQWKQELWEKFMLPAELLERKNLGELLSPKAANNPCILICSYEFAGANYDRLSRRWDLVIADEAHRLRNFWNGKAKTAEAVAHIFQASAKVVLLTATPLQNRLEELYGLVSTFDPSYFHSLDAFRERYIKHTSLDSGDDLADRVALISKRTLRKDAEKYIPFTQRIPLTIEFDSSPEEQKLYELVDDYLSRDKLWAFTSSQRFLSAMILRKRLGSSTYAIASTLENIADRLQAQLTGRNFTYTDTHSGLFDAELDDLTSEEVQIAADALPYNRDELTEAEKRTAIAQELEELRGFAALARSIKVNQKAVHLKEALDQGFAKLREVGAPEKAIIFTDSTITQQYLAEHLTSIGYGGGLVLFNGSNKSEASTEIYRQWLEANNGSDLITRNAAADRRKALVDYFRDHGSIMIATEAASEGVNLQFASMLINYDLPWNPQRVEQRIGRIHRFGQKYNVVIANFSNRSNTAEQRILELLSEKFKLFSSVFGASDEILGSIEDGLDVERKINDILADYKTAEEISAAFDQLASEYATEISTEMSKAKSKVFDNLDPHVQDRLKNYDAQSEVVLNQFERLLLELTKYELKEFADFDDAGHNFHLHHAPVPSALVGDYYFKSTPIPNAHQYRYASPLSQFVINRALTTETPDASFIFSLNKSERVPKAIQKLSGQSGELVVKKITFRINAGEQDLSESYLLAAATTDSGEILDAEFVDDILNLTAVESHDCDDIDQARFDDVLQEQAATYDKEVKNRNSRYYNEQDDVLQSSLEDRRAEHEKQIREWKAKVDEYRKQARHADDAMESLSLKKKANRLEEKIDDADDEFRTLRRKMRQQSNDYLDSVAQALKGSEEQEPVLALRWEIQN